MTPTAEPTAFDIDAIRTPWLRHHYQSLQRRYDRIAHSVQTTYPLGPRRIKTQFVHLDHANASVGRTERGYQIEIAAAFPALLHALFAKLMGDASLLPWMEIGEAEAISQNVAFALDPHDLHKHETSAVRSAPHRDRAALTLSDVAAQFVFLHEISHILAGHAALLPENGKARLQELRLVRPASQPDAAALRNQEFEADTIGAGLLVEYVEAIASEAQSASPDPALRAMVGHPKIAREHSTALAIVAVYGLFRYLRGTASALERNTSYPDPMVRAFCVRDVMVHRMAQRHAFDRELFTDLLLARFEEVNEALEAMGLPSGIPLSDAGLDQVAEELDKLAAARTAQAHLTDKHRYIDWSESRL